MKQEAVQRRQKGNNRGSALIEMTLLIPILLGCIYFYIMLFLFLTETAGDMYGMAEYLYESERTNESVAGTVSKSGNTEIISIKSTGKLFEIRAELRRDASDAIENIRRWQLVTGGI
ncbi:MAG: hypothetical protein NC347_05365 [Clostridium sp.]|nr:hypothetical protein [Clostridium sp.]